MARRLPNRAERLLEDARTGVQYIAFDIDDQGKPTSRRVPASILSRFDSGTPMNELEGEFFEFIKLNPDFIDDASALIGAWLNAGQTRWSTSDLIAVFRWHLKTRKAYVRVIDEFKLDDHYSPYLARIFNEVLDAPFFEVRKAKGEPDGGNEDKSDQDSE